jgi:hypothetical protein
MPINWKDLTSADPIRTTTKHDNTLPALSNEAYLFLMQVHRALCAENARQNKANPDTHVETEIAYPLGHTGDGETFYIYLTLTPKHKEN